MITMGIYDFLIAQKTGSGSGTKLYKHELSRNRVDKNRNGTMNGGIL